MQCLRAALQCISMPSHYREPDGIALAKLRNAMPVHTSRGQALPSRGCPVPAPPATAGEGAISNAPLPAVWGSPDRGGTARGYTPVGGRVPVTPLHALHRDTRARGVTPCTVHIVTGVSRLAPCAPCGGVTRVTVTRVRWRPHRGAGRAGSSSRRRRRRTFRSGLSARAVRGRRRGSAICRPSVR